MGIYKITRMLMMTRMIRLIEEDEVEEEEYVIRAQRRRDWYMNGCVPSVRDRWQSEGASFGTLLKGTMAPLLLPA